jgi:2-C-methyl-D-erythritol 2,4-cyclodiphosphate synthase
MRVGIGFDVHRLVEGRRLFLGGVEIPHPKGLLGHSDGDVLIHAVADAILGAMAEEDIGTHFPDSDENLKGMESSRILRKVREIVEARGLEVVNIDAVVAAQEPKIAPHRERIRKSLAGLLNMDEKRVGVRGKTTEGLGFTGRKEGIAVWAVALVQEKAAENEMAWKGM